MPGISLSTWIVGFWHLADMLARGPAVQLGVEPDLTKTRAVRERPPMAIPIVKLCGPALTDASCLPAIKIARAAQTRRWGGHHENSIAHCLRHPAVRHRRAGRG